MEKTMPRLWPYFLVVWLLAFVGFHKYESTAFEAGRWQWQHHVHGALLMGWLVLMAAQPILIVNRKLAWHKALGKVSYFYAPIMLASVYALPLLWVQEALELNDPQAVTKALARSILPMSKVVLFALFYGLAMYWQRYSQKHKRWLIGASILLMGPSLARLDFGFLGAWVPFDFWAWLLDAVALGFFLFDRLWLRRSGGIFAIICLCIWADHYAFLYLGVTEVWQQIARSLFF